MNELTSTYLIMQDTSVVGSSGDFGAGLAGLHLEFDLFG